MLSKLKLSQKIPGIMISMALLTAILVGWIAIQNATKDSLDAASQKLLALEASRAAALGDYLKSIEQDLSTLSTNATTLAALREFTSGFDGLGFGNTKSYLQKQYIEDNKNPAGSKHLLDFAPDGSAYSETHKKYHPWFRQFLTEKSYYDIFLFDKRGNIVYTVFKELDFATNVLSGEWKDTDIATVFKNARDNAKSGYKSFTDFKPYAPSANVPAAFISTPIFDEQGQFEGVVAFQMPIGRINEVMQVSTGMGETGETYLVGNDYLMRSDSRFSKESTILKTKVDGSTVVAGLEGKSGVETIKDYRGVDVVSAHGPIDFVGTRWAVIAEIDLSEVMSPIYKMQKNIALSTAAVLLVIAVIAFFAARQIAKPISGMTQSMKKLAAGDHSVAIPGVGRFDEIGDMAAAVQVFKDTALETERLKAEQAALEARTAEEKKKAMNDLADRFQTQVGSIVNSISSAATELQATAETMTGSASETAQQSNTVAAASEEASANVQTVSAATEELTASITEIQNRVEQSTRTINQAVVEAEQANRKVQGLTEAARKIGDVINLINDIAAQTNLLALNATIEAARAGDAGKGFAVVASEVKNLANQTAKATDEIAQQIGSIQSETQSSADAIQSITRAIASVSDTANAIASAVEQQSLATQEIARNVNEAAQGTRDVTINITKVSGGAQRTGAAASQVSAASSELAESGERMRSSVHKFLNDIRAS